MKEFRSYIDDETGERVSGLFDMSEEQINALEASRAPYVPEQVSAAQALLALHNANLLDEVEAAIETVDYAPIRIYWQRQATWRRAHPYIQAVQAELGWSDEQIDQLFLAAEALD